MLKKWVVGIAIFAGVLVVLASVGILIGWYATGFSASSASADSQYKAWKANNLPKTSADLFLTSAPAPEDNAAELWYQAFKVLEAKGDTSIDSELLKKENWENGKLAAYIEARRDVLDLAFLAAEKPELRFKRDWDLGPEVLFPEFSDLKAIAKLLSFDAQIRAKQGDAVGASRQIWAARRMAAQCAKEPILIGALVAFAIDSIAVNGAAASAADLAGDEAGLTMMRSAIESTQWEWDKEISFRGEALMGLESIRLSTNEDIYNLLFGSQVVCTLSAGPSDPEPEPPAPVARQSSEIPRDILPRAVSAEVMAFWNEFYPRLCDPKEDFGALVADMESRSISFSSSRSLPQLLAAQTHASFKGCELADRRRRTVEDTAIAYIGMLQYHQRHGDWPKSLKQAGVEGEDEIGRQPIQYRASGATARVWNAGRNGFDDGGITSWELMALGKTGLEFDEAFIYPWPPLKK